MYKKVFIFIVFMSQCWINSQIDPKKVIWIEGEHPSQNNMARHPWWYDKVKTNTLSGQDWISNFSKTKKGTASYQFKVLVAAKYTFWVRANPIAKAELSYKLNDQNWQKIDFKKDQRGLINIAADNKPDMRFIAWSKVGKIYLKKGKQTIVFRMDSQNHNHGAIDCFTFVRVPFAPSGAKKPTTKKLPAKNNSWFAVIADEDAFSSKSIIDMSSLIEAPAGKYGFLTKKQDKLYFKKKNKPVKFWGCGANIGRFTKKQQLQRIRYLRKHGVNIIRIHPVFDELGPLVNGKFNVKNLDLLDWYFAKLKEHGIYSTWSFFYHFTIDSNADYPQKLFRELKKKNGRRDTYAIASFHPYIQKLKWRYMKKLLLHKNSYTNLRYIDDPALAIIEFQNEDCIFFHNPLNLYRDPNKFPQHSLLLAKKWGKWVQKKYASKENLIKAWGKLANNDFWKFGEFELMGAYHLGKDGPLHEFRGQQKRAGDFIEFLTVLQRGIYKRTEKQVRKLGFKGITVTTAWRAGGAAADPANLYCDAVADMIDRHNYYGGGAGRHNILEGDVHTQSHLELPGSGLLASGMYQVKDQPFAMTEWSATPPYWYKMEAAPIIAFFGLGLQGWDASFHFLNKLTHVGSGWPGNSKYSTDTPHYIGQFPALAFAIYQGHIKEGAIACWRKLSKRELFAGKDSLGQDFTGGTHDYKKIKGKQKTPLPLLAIGKVVTSFSKGKDKKTNWTRFWNKKKGVVRSNTRELIWNYKKQRIFIGSKKTQAFIGKAAKQIKLPAVVLSKVKTSFISIIFTPLDNLRLKDSANILITAMARDKNTNARYNQTGSKLTSVGGPPLLMEPVQAEILFKGKTPKVVKALDIYGVPKKKRLKIAEDGSFYISGKYQTYYYQVKR